MTLDELPPERDPWKDEGHSELDEWIRRAKNALLRGLRKKAPGPPVSPRRPQWRRSLPWAIALLLGAWLASGLSAVTPGQTALLYAFGYPVREVHQGHFWNWPAPLGRVIYVNLAKEHSRYVIFHTFTKRGHPVLVTIHYLYRKVHAQAAIGFAVHPGLWLRGLLMSALTRWTVAHDRVLRSPNEPERQTMVPSTILLRSRLNRVLLKEHSGLVLEHVRVSIAPGRTVRSMWKNWEKRSASAQEAIRVLKHKLDIRLVRQKEHMVKKESRIKVLVQRWIGRARILVARFYALLPVYRKHPTLVRQTLIQALYERSTRTVSLDKIQPTSGLSRGSTLGPSDAKMSARLAKDGA